MLKGNGLHPVDKPRRPHHCQERMLLDCQSEAQDILQEDGSHKPVKPLTFALRTVWF